MTKLSKGPSYISVEDSLDVLIKLGEIDTRQYETYKNMAKGDDEMYDLCYAQVGFIFKGMWYKNVYPRRTVIVNCILSDITYPKDTRLPLFKNIAKYKKNARPKSRKA